MASGNEIKIHPKPGSLETDTFLGIRHIISRRVLFSQTVLQHMKESELAQENPQNRFGSR